mmetsp:Transcript_14286/g.45774  ORF Transcript_14286/g.45774 Transcript_14286/m.45774 type:complete len:230 (+) Transcript_14286:68-757(+)
MLDTPACTRTLLTLLPCTCVPTGTGHRACYCTASFQLSSIASLSRRMDSASASTSAPQRIFRKRRSRPVGVGGLALLATAPVVTPLPPGRHASSAASASATAALTIRAPRAATSPGEEEPPSPRRRRGGDGRAGAAWRGPRRLVAKRSGDVSGELEDDGVGGVLGGGLSSRLHAACTAARHASSTVFRSACRSWILACSETKSNTSSAEGAAATASSNLPCCSESCCFR